MVDDQMLRDQAAHRSAEYGRGCNLNGVEHRHHVDRHRRQRRVAHPFRLADAAWIEGDDALRPRQVGKDRGEHRPARTEPRDEQ